MTFVEIIDFMSNQKKQDQSVSDASTTSLRSLFLIN